MPKLPSHPRIAAEFLSWRTFPFAGLGGRVMQLACQSQASGRPIWFKTVLSKHLGFRYWFSARSIRPPGLEKIAKRLVIDAFGTAECGPKEFATDVKLGDWPGAA
jgi:hypothetical protein